MIINFSINNFRSIKDKVTLSFEATKDKTLENYYVVEPQKGLRILKMGIIYGHNASGKTNILKALDFLRKIVIQPFDTKDKVFNFDPFLFNDNTQQEPSEFELEFWHEGKKFFYYVQLNRNAILEEKLFYYNPNRSLVYKRFTETDTQFSKIEFGNKFKKDYKISATDIKILEGNTLWNNTVLGGFLKTNLNLSFLRIITLWFKTKLFFTIFPCQSIPNITERLFDEEKIKQQIFKTFNNADIPIIDFEIEEEEVKENEFINHEDYALRVFINPNENTKSKLFKIKKYTIHRVDNKHYKLDFINESSGSKRFFKLSGILIDILNNDKILTIDEIESSLHPDLVKHFLLTFLANSNEAQLIATTHMRELLMEKDILRHDIIWFTERKEDQSTDLYSLADFDTSVIRKANSVYKFYKAGRLGAVPNLGSYYLNLDNGEEKKR